MGFVKQLKYNKLNGGIYGEQSGRVQKIPINAGFSCPNRDGTKGTGGCLFCSNQAFIPFYTSEQNSIEKQLATGKKFYREKYKCHQFVAYFQAFSNTYAPLGKLKEIYESVLHDPEFVGIVIGTRPDCIDTELIDYLQVLSENYHIGIEYGVETFKDEVLKKINRGHSAQESIDAINMTAGKNIQICAHMILGLPGQTKDDIINDAKIISSLPIDSLKLHHLQILENTELASLYAENPASISLFSAGEYVSTVADFLENLNPNIAVERLINEVPARYLIAPKWGGLRASDFEDMLNNEFAKRNTIQGIYS